MVASLVETRGTSLSMTYLFINAGDEADPAPKASRLQEDTKSILAHGRNDVIQALCCSQLDTFKKYYAEFMNQYPKDEYIKVYEQGVKEELFLSKYQRSLYNVKRLAAQPWWEPEQTNYSEYFKAIQENWQVIRAEGMAALEENHILFQDEAENLKDIGNWKQLELLAWNNGSSPRDEHSRSRPRRTLKDFEAWQSERRLAWPGMRKSESPYWNVLQSATFFHGLSRTIPSPLLLSFSTELGIYYAFGTDITTIGPMS
uniref:Uncharacterized protein n=1 Tax=Timema poppense TaxID=170557 RepID=A0A7R9D4J7_TIMPO|nr:unnamed protein product [Timema poppensis]